MSDVRPEIFDPSLDVFKVHFENDPIVPGMLLLLRELQRRTRPAESVVRIEHLSFKSFVRPNQQVNYLTEGAETQIFYGSDLCCFFSTGIGTKVDSPVFIDEECISTVAATPARDPRYWFLPGHVSVNAADTHAQTCVDLQEVITQHPYLEQISNPALLVITEALGNLALLLQKRHSASAGSYVFAKFDSLDIDLDRPLTGLPLNLKARVRHFGPYLVWDACAWDEKGMRLAIHNAVSVKRRTA